LVRNLSGAELSRSKQLRDVLVFTKLGALWMCAWGLPESWKMNPNIPQEVEGPYDE
jgi:hypothetical protein